MRAPVVACALLFAVVACGASDPPAQNPSDASTDLGSPTDATTGDASADSGADSLSSTDATDASSLVADLLAKVANCKQVSAGKFKTDDQVNLPENIPVCGLVGAVFWQADMDIDCDGKTTSVCNRSTDASYQSSTAAVDSRGKALDASTLPYIVVPGVSSRWSYRTSGIKMGSVAAVIYNGKIEYGVVGDVGPQAIVGEASYAMAKKLGINPNPSTGGVSSGVTYVVFKGAGPSKIEDRDATTKLGIERAKKLIADN